LTDVGLQQLKEMKSLQTLSLYWTRVTDAGLEHLGGLSNLKVLYLVGTPVSDVGFAHLQGLPLEQLYVPGTRVTDRGVAKFTNLKVLNIGNQVTDATLGNLTGLTRLETLALSYTDVTANGLKVLARFPSLKVLSLSGEKITDKGLENLKTLQKLTELRLEDTEVTSAGVTALQAALPNCKITREPPSDPSTIPPSPASPDKPVEPRRAAVTGSEAPPPPAVAPFDATKAKQHQEAWATHLGVPVEETTSIGMKLVLIPPGEFEMGSTAEQIAWAIEEDKKYNIEQRYLDQMLIESPRHRVEITKPFYLSVYEITQAVYENVVGSNPSNFKGDVRQPVEKVTWFDAVVFCNRLSERERIQSYYRIDGQAVFIVGGNGYRLPTEAEWEYACRAGTSTKWNFGDDKSKLGDYAWHNGNSGGSTHRVGEKKSNLWGLYDMYGNVWEWCWDWGPAKYETESAKDPMGLSGAAGRVLRGGAFSDRPEYLRSANRNPVQPSDRYINFGFRPARTYPSSRTVRPSPAISPAESDPDGDDKTATASPDDSKRRAVALQTKDWNGLPQCWRINRQGIMGSTGPTGIDFNTFLCTKKTYRNFELSCQVRLITGNTGVQFRSDYEDQGKFVLRGPQVDIGPGYWGNLHGEKTGGVMKAAPEELVKRIIKPDAFNDVFVRCVVSFRQGCMNPLGRMV
jgi:formylglycine-generating enzyme required for sulfatase activity